MISDDSKIEMLLEKSLMEGLSPEEVCIETPELLSTLREQWQACQSVNRELENLFPSAPPVLGGRPPLVPNVLPKIPGYELYDVLGQGGMGVVYRGRHLKLNRVIALKMMLPGTCIGPVELRRFEREAQIVASLCHPHIVQVFDVGDVDGSPYYTMELISGGSLAKVLDGTPQPVRSSAVFISKLADAIDLVHRNGIIHRDIKPGNILLGDEYLAKISDFGLAFQTEGRPDQTLNSTRLGTPSYMSPEQALGQTSSIGPAADIYSFGAVLYELLTGRPPFQAESALEVQRQLIYDEPVAPARLNPKVPRDLQAICLKCLEKEPRQRYRTAGEFRDDLERFLNHLPVHARPVSHLDRIHRWTQRNRATSVALVSVVALLMILLVGSLWATSHFHTLAFANGTLADTNRDLALGFQEERDKAWSAERRENGLHRQAAALSAELKQNLYVAEMNLAAQASMLPGGIARVSALIGNWDQTQPDLRGWEWYYLNAICHRDERTVEAHLRGALSIAWDPDGARLASGGADATICIFDRFGSKPQQRLFGHQREVMDVAWDRLGQRLASASWDGLVKIWDVTSESLLFDCIGHATEVYCVAWSPDETRLASGGKDGVIRIWDTSSGQQVGTLSGHNDAVSDIAWSPDGRQIVSASHDFIVRVWSVGEATLLHRMEGHLNWVNRVAWSPDGNRVCSGSNDQTLRVWDPETGKPTLTINAHTQGVTGVCWSPDSQQIATCSDDLSIKIWSSTTGDELFHTEGHVAELTNVAWRPDGTEIASSSYDGTVKIWNIQKPSDGKLPVSRNGNIERVIWNPSDLNLLAVCCSEGVVQIWDQQRHQVSTVLQAAGTYLRSATWHPDGGMLATTSADGSVRIWDLQRPSLPVQTLQHHGEVMAVSWKPDGQLLATNDGDNRIALWDTSTGKIERWLEGHRQPVSTLCWHPHKDLLASGSQDGTAIIWDIRTGEPRLRVEHHHAPVISIAWKPDGSQIASASMNPVIHLWDDQTGHILKTLNGHMARVSQIAWSPDGRRIGSAGRDGHLKIWEVDSGREVLSLGDRNVPLNSMSWNKDGTAIAVSSEEQSVSVYNAEPGYLAAYSPLLLTQLHQRLEGRHPPETLLLKAHIAEHMFDWDRTGERLAGCLDSTTSPWILLDGYISPLFCLNAWTPNEPFVSDQELKQVLTTASFPDYSQPWRRIENSDQGVIDLMPWTQGQDHTSIFVLFPVFSKTLQDTEILTGSDDDSRLWVNSQQVYQFMGSRTARPDQDAIPITLQAGWNWILAEVVNRTGEHGLYIRLSPFEKAESRPQPSQ